MIRWGAKSGQTSGYKPEQEQRTYPIVVKGTLADEEMTQKNVFEFKLKIDCCYYPTVISAPMTDSATYEYNVGDPKLEIMLSGFWEGDNDCCRIKPQRPSVDPEPDFGIFHSPGDFTKLEVDWQNPETGPVGR